jgi:cyclomaltodextrinase / maltogenic alpha-amylase / neopullulanase
MGSFKGRGMSHSRYNHRAGVAFLATVAALLSPVVALTDSRAIVLQGDGGDAWTFEKRLEGELPDGGCDEVLVASPRATVQAWQADGRFGAVVPLLEGDNEVRAICRLGATDRSVSQPQHWRVRLRDVPKAWIRIVPAEDGIVLDAGASEPAPARSAPIIEHQWRSEPGNPQPLTTADGSTLGGGPITGDALLLRLPRIAGEYQVTLRVTDALGRSDESTAAFVVENGDARASELAEERPAWLDSAVVYGVAPFFFGTAALMMLRPGSTPSGSWVPPCCGCRRSPAPRRATSAMP